MRYCYVERRLGLYAADAFVRVSEVRAAGSGGERRLMIRVADQRKNLLVEAHARLLMYYTDLYPDQCAPAPARHCSYPHRPTRAPSHWARCPWLPGRNRALSALLSGLPRALPLRSCDASPARPKSPAAPGSAGRNTVGSAGRLTSAAAMDSVRGA